MSDYKLSNCQQKVIDQAINNFYNKENTIIKAVTGSGKTLMMTHIIAEILSTISNNEKIAIIVATLSTSGLHEEIFNKFEKYVPTFPKYKQFEYELIQSPSASKQNKMEDIKSIPLENKKVLILGKSSFGKNGKLMQDKFDEFILELQKYDHVLYFRDEAHIGLSKNVNSKFESELNKIATFKCMLSATPNILPNFKIITLTENDLQNDNIKLIKSNEDNLLLNFGNKDVISSNELLNSALEQFVKQIVPNYKSRGHKIPAMLIQVSDNSNIDKEKHREFIEKMTKHMSLILKYCNEYNLKYYINFDDLNDIPKTNSKYDNLTLNDIGKDNNDIHIVIFKLGASVGWDIPRACVLVQLRDVYSEKLNIQTIGRIKRHPYPELENPDPYFDKYWIYSNNNVKENEIGTYYLNPNFKDEDWEYKQSVGIVF